MKLYCVEDFKSAVENLQKSKPYRDIQKTVIEHFCNKEISEISNGTNLNNNTVTPYIKKRLNGSGGYRIYYYLIVKDDRSYLMYIHPKTGPEGSDNVTTEGRTLFLKNVLDAISTNNLYEVTCNKEKTKLIFEKIEDTVVAIKSSPSKS
jgi:hypothetical protein